MNRSILVPRYIKELRGITALLRDQEPGKRNNGLSQMKSYLQSLSGMSINWYRVFKSCEVDLLGRLRDSCPINRQHAISAIEMLYINSLPHASAYLAPLWLVLSDLLSKPRKMEEYVVLRVQLLELLLRIASTYETQFLEKGTKGTVGILQAMFKESYAPIVALSCKITIVFFEKCAKIMKSMSILIIRALITNKVRDIHVREDVIRCLGFVVMNNTNPGLGISTLPLAERLLDDSPITRETVIQVATKWALDHASRYNHFGTLIPLILVGLNDVVDGVGKEAHKGWNDVGLKYKQENFDVLQYRPEYLTEVPDFYPDYIIRPSLGCRLLVQRYMAKMLPAVIQDLQNARPKVRRRGSQLLCTIVLHAEHENVPMANKILQSIFEAAHDEDNEIVTNIIQAAMFLACFIRAKTWWKVFMRAFGNSGHYGHFLILQSLIKASPTIWFHEVISQVLKQLSKPYHQFNIEPRYREELANCKMAIANRIPLNSKLKQSLWRYLGLLE